jgi:uncharacterized protein (DUF1778 family)
MTALRVHLPSRRSRASGRKGRNPSRRFSLRPTGGNGGELAKNETIMKTKSKRIEARVKPDTLVLVQRAAELQGSSVSEFVVSAAEKEARRALEEASTIRLSVEDQRRFVELLLSPPEPTPALERARSAHEALIGPV